MDEDAAPSSCHRVQQACPGARSRVRQGELTLGGRKVTPSITVRWSSDLPMRRIRSFDLRLDAVEEP